MRKAIKEFIKDYLWHCPLSVDERISHEKINEFYSLSRSVALVYYLSYSRKDIIQRFIVSITDPIHREKIYEKNRIS